MPEILEISVIKSSAIPSEKYSCSGSPDRFSNGKIAIEGLSGAGLQVRPYFHRYTEDALDLCDVLGSFTGQAKVKLDEIAKVLGLAGKPQGIDGSQVEDLVNDGKLDQVADYCETDVFTTYRVWLVYELFRGSINSAELEWSEAQAREFITSRRKSNRYLSATMGIQGP